jgi:hypothetical protein
MRSIWIVNYVRRYKMFLIHHHCGLTQGIIYNPDGPHQNVKIISSLFNLNGLLL